MCNLKRTKTKKYGTKSEIKLRTKKTKMQFKSQHYAHNLVSV